MSKDLTTDGMKYIVARLVDNANEAIGESRADNGDTFKAGRSLAYYEMLDILKSELDVREQDLAEYGLNINLETRYL